MRRELDQRARYVYAACVVATMLCRNFVVHCVDLAPRRDADIFARTSGSAHAALRADEWRDDIAHLQEKLGQTPRADKQGAHAIKQAIMRTQSKLQRLKPVVASYRAALEKRETHSLWVEGVRAVCGHDALHEVYDWMAAEKRRRAQIARDAQAPQF
jgi:hypothetical protein